MQRLKKKVIIIRARKNQVVGPWELDERVIRFKIDSTVWKLDAMTVFFSKLFLFFFNVICANYTVKLRFSHN